MIVLIAGRWRPKAALGACERKGRIPHRIDAVADANYVQMRWQVCLACVCFACVFLVDCTIALYRPFCLPIVLLPLR